MRRTPAGITITSNGRLAAPLDLVTRQCVLRYDANWRPIDLTVDAVARGAAMAIKTTFADGQATSEITQAGAPTTKTDTVAPDTLVLPNLFFSAYEALAMRLASIPDGSSFPAYIAPQAEITVKQTARSTQKIETARRVIDVRTYALTFQNPGAPLDAIVWTDETGRLLKFEVAGAVADLRPRGSRVGRHARAGRQPRRRSCRCESRATASTSPARSASRRARRRRVQGRYPAIVLVGGSGPTDRDETVAGIPMFGLLASPLADAGYFVLRYDKRGVGQSGGRAEAGTVQDFAEDVRAVAAVPAQAQGRRSEADRPRSATARARWCRCWRPAATKTSPASSWRPRRRVPAASWCSSSSSTCWAR